MEHVMHNEFALIYARAQLAKWRNWELLTRSSFVGYDLPIALRRRPSEQVVGRPSTFDIETSSGAMVPARVANRIWTRVSKTRATGIPYRRNVAVKPGVPCGVDSVAVDGTLVAGGHTIHFDEMQALATKLGW